MANISRISTDDGSQGKMRNWMRLTFMPKAVRSSLKQVLVMLWTIQEATLTILAAAIPMIWVPSVISPLPLRLLQRPLRCLTVCLLFFDDQSFFVFPFGQVDS